MIKEIQINVTKFGYEVRWEEPLMNGCHEICHGIEKLLHQVRRLLEPDEEEKPEKPASTDPITLQERVDRLESAVKEVNLELQRHVNPWATLFSELKAFGVSIGEECP